MDSTRKWIFAAAAAVAVSTSTSAFAQAKPKTDTKTQRTHDEKAKQAEQEAEQQRAAERERAATTTVTSAEPPMPPTPPPGAEKEPRINMPLMAAGTLLFFGTYLPTAAIGFVGRTDDKPLIVPVVGPWIALGERDCDADPCGNEGLDKALMVTSGILQGAGLVAVALSVFIPPPERGLPGATAKSKSNVHVAPVSIGKGGAGVGAFGVF
jgi:hypothetical protein